MPEQTEAEVWAVVDQLGHKRMAGRLSEVEMFGGKLARIDIPQDEGFTTKYFGAASVYEITFVTEAVARHVAAKGTSPAPVQPWDFPKQLPAAGHAPATQQPYSDREITDSTEPQPTCRNCSQPAVPGCGNGRCAIHCDERCDSSCERALCAGDDPGE